MQFLSIYVGSASEIYQVGNSCTFISKKTAFCYLVKYYHPYFTEEWPAKKLHDLLTAKNVFSTVTSPPSTMVPDKLILLFFNQE